jgi:DNA-binding SARP family transcriptional activator
LAIAIQPAIRGLEGPKMGARRRTVAVIGPLGVYPMTRLSLPARRIIAYLGVRGRTVSRAIAAAELWPDQTEDVGRGNLRRALWNTPAHWIAVHGDELTLEAETDLARAEVVAAAALGGAALDYEHIRLLSDDILPGWLEEWVLPLQERFHNLRVQALEAACRTMTAAGALPLAIEAGAAALAAEPLRESAAEALIAAHLAQHNRFEALRCFKALARRLADELGVDPDPGLAARLRLAA